MKTAPHSRRIGVGTLCHQQHEQVVRGAGRFPQVWQVPGDYSAALSLFRAAWDHRTARPAQSICCAMSQTACFSAIYVSRRPSNSPQRMNECRVEARWNTLPPSHFSILRWQKCVARSCETELLSGGSVISWCALTLTYFSPKDVGFDIRNWASASVSLPRPYVK